MKPLQQYFGLQITLLKRQLTDFGVNPLVGFMVILLGFYVLSFYLFNKTEYAGYIYVIIAISIIFKNSDSNRNEFLKFVFFKKYYLGIRMAENVITAIPFLIFLLYKKEAYPFLLLFLLAVLATLVNTHQKGSITIPTPFYKKPFEFIVGFRTLIATFFIAYFLTCMAVRYQNFNLGLFSLAFIFLVCLSFYNKPEDTFYVWVHTLTPQQFLLNKIKTAVIFSSLLSVPVMAALLYFFNNHYLIIAGVQLLGYCYLINIIVTKYAAYPKKMNLPQALLIALSFMMPPALLVLIPFFYFKAHQQLKEILA